MGPLSMMFSGVNQQNDQDYRQRGRGGDREIFNSRLSRLSNNFDPANINRSSEPPLILGDPGQPVHGGLLEEESVFAPRRGRGPMSFRDPQQGGPQPPVDPRILAQLFGGQ